MKLSFFNIIDEKSKTKTSKFLNLIICLLIIINIGSIIAESFKELATPYHRTFRFIEIYSIIIFTFEYLCRLLAFIEKRNLSFKSIKTFVLRPSSIIDLIAIYTVLYPFYYKSRFTVLKI
jgi:voltage-gated potassium channel